jgi:hypothetical protein
MMNWPPCSPDLNPVHYQVRGHIANEGKGDTRDGLLQRILDTARHVNNATVLRKITRSPEKRTGLCIPADGGDFEKLL